MKLTDLNAGLVTAKADGVRVTYLIMDCPLRGCDHTVWIPYQSGGGVLPDGRPIWDHVAGTDVNDMSLSPSYHLMTSDGHCGLHGFVRSGYWVGCAEARHWSK